MNSQKNIPDELKSLNSNLPAPAGQPVFSVPDGYFDGLAASILAKVKSSDFSVTQELQDISPVLAGISKETPYSIPLFYFEQNLDGLPGIMGTAAPSVLDTLDKRTPFTVPQNYFTSLPEQVLAKVIRPTARVVPFFRQMRVRLAAAVLGGALLVAGYQYFDTKSQTTVADDTTQNTQPLMALNTPAIEMEIKKASISELENFIQTVPATKSPNIKSAPAVSKEDVKELLKDVSDKDMETFLVAVPTVDDDPFATD